MEETKQKEVVSPVVETAQEVEVPAQAEPEKSPREIELEQELEKVRQEAKAHQKTASKKAQEAQDFKAAQESINKRIDILAEMLEEKVVKESDDIEPPKPKAKTYQERVKELQAESQSSEKKQIDTYQQQINAQIALLVKGAGLEQNDERLIKAENKWYKGDFDGALEEVTKVVKEVSAVKDDKDKKIMQLEAELNKLKKIESGVLDAETGQPSSSNSPIPTDINKFREWVRTIPTETYEKEYASKVNEMRRQGKIK